MWIASIAAVLATQTGIEHRPSALRVFSNVALHLKENYYDPTKINPQSMLRSGIDAVCRSAPAVSCTRDGTQQTIQVNGRKLTISTDDVESLWEVNLKAHEVMRFIERSAGSLPDGIEHSFIAGALSALDGETRYVGPSDTKPATKHRRHPILTAGESSSTYCDASGVGDDLEVIEGIAHIPLGTMASGCATRIAKWVETRKNKIRGLILDLRACPGGVLAESASVSDLFLSKGRIFTTLAYGGRLRAPKRAEPHPSDIGLPVVVLVGRNTTGGGEIIAAALKHHERALLLGAPTLGKRAIQIFYEFPDRSGLQLTKGHAYTPDDDLAPVTPHVSTATNTAEIARKTLMTSGTKRLSKLIEVAKKLAASPR